MKLENGQNLQDHLEVFVELLEELAIIGDAMEEEERVIILLSSLPDRFSTLVTSLEAHEKIPAWEVVTERLPVKIASATQHMCNKQSEFSSYSDLSSPVRVEIGDGRALKGIGVGDVRLKITLPNMQKKHFMGLSPNCGVHRTRNQSGVNGFLKRKLVQMEMFARTKLGLLLKGMLKSLELIMMKLSVL
ncbi:hypothetical protein FHG87_025574 [Trinorchestia longiramus]|nr:hypothetical protein FHG87_025574 [Trinorchestia longiramus]